ncbi:MAG: hypothetical protein COA58_09620 [Bacteroidetes bacterium]|nr:MAG: hypothetical protein COA58_09620 [Bacteroidota bacterium]
MKLLKTDFLKNAGKLLSGSFVAQVIGLGAIIFLARLYDPDQFGELDTMLKMVAVMVAIAGLRYEVAIVVEDNERDAQEITRLSLILNGLISIILLGIILLFKEQIATFFQLKNSNILFLLPLFVWLMSSTESLMNWKNRAKEYETISTNRVLTSLAGVGYKLSHPFTNLFQGNGLVIGHLIGQSIAFIHIARKLPFSIFNTSRETLKKIALKYKSFAVFSSPAALLNILATSMPFFMIAAYDSQAATGHFGNAYKLTYLPMSMLAMALGQVFFERIARLKSNKKEAAEISHQLFNLMFGIAVIPVVILAVWGDQIAPFILGEKWEEAGVYIQITIFFYFSMFLTSSFSSAFSTYGKLNIQLVYNATFLIATFSALYFSYKTGASTRVALAWFVVVGTILRIFILNYFFILFGKNLIAKTIFAILIVAVLSWFGFGLKEGF